MTLSSVSTSLAFHEVANLFPLIEGQEFDDLVKDITENGLKQPIWVYQNKIIDGRNRYRACNMAGVEPRFQEWDEQGSLVAFVISLNVKRRHLTSSQLGVIALGVERQLAEEATVRHALNGGDKVSAFAPAAGQNFDPKTSAKSAHLAADLLGTNHDYVSAAKRIEREAPELLSHITEGTLTIPDARAIASLPQERRTKVVTKAVQKREEEGKRVSRAVKDAISEEEVEIRKIRMEEEAKQVILPQSLRLLHTDFRSSGHGTVSDASVDLLFTDPPYHGEHLHLWSDLASFAARVLKPGGVLLAYSGQVFLPDVLNRLMEHLDYCWLLGIQHTGGHIQIWKHTLWNDWKPLVMFSKGIPTNHEWFMDLYRGDKGDKDAHEWSQGEGEAAYFIEKLTKPGQFVLDPMCGSGTILRAAQKLGRHSLGMEVDEDRYTVALASMKEMMSA